MIRLPPATERQRSIFDFICATIRERHMAPTVREIGSYFGISSPNGVMWHLKALEKKGLITREPTHGRNIAVNLGAVECCQMCGRKVKA